MLAVVQMELCEAQESDSVSVAMVIWMYKGDGVMRIQLQEKTEKNPYHQRYQQKHHLMVIVMKKLLM